MPHHGSAIPNPGPCGAGFAIRLVGESTYTETAVPLGMGDNNKGEMGAIKGVGEAVLAAISAGRVKTGSDLLIFSDSALCIGFLEHGWSFSTWLELGHETRAIFRILGKLVRVRFYWIRGHAGIPGNELADGVAKRAAREAAAEMGLEEAGARRPP